MYYVSTFSTNTKLIFTEITERIGRFGVSLKLLSFKVTQRKVYSRGFLKINYFFVSMHLKT